MSSSAAIDTINSFLDPKLHQVIGSTPGSLREAVESVDLKNKPDLGLQFVSLSLFACTVNKPTVEEFFITDKFKDLRPITSRAFVLNGKINMTALSLAGHCFMTVDAFEEVHYVKEFRKKIGQKSIWDGSLAAGSIGEVQRKIFREKSTNHSRDDALDFALWFLEHTGITSLMKMGAKAPKRDETPRGRRVPADDALMSPTTRERERSTLSYEIPDDINDYWFTTRGKTKSELDKVVAERGLEGAWTKIRRDIARGGGSTTV